MYFVPHIIHLSLLNPPMHPRMFYKLAISQKEAGYEVSIITQDPSEYEYDVRGIQILPLTPFSRISVNRLKVQKKIFRKAKSLKADLYILHSPELLFVGRKLKKHLNCKVIYDVHENYQLNLTHAIYYPPLIRKVMGWTVRRIEQLSAKWLDGISYAERCYENILDVPNEKYVILENTFTNRAADSDPDISIPSQPYLLLSGTIAEERGIWESLNLWKKLNQYQPVNLVVAGHCQLPMLLSDIHKYVNESGLRDHFSLIGGEDYVSYANILQLISHCQAGLFLYKSLPNIIGKRPTKIFEYLAFAKPLIFTDHPHWNALNQELQMGFPLKEGQEGGLPAQIAEWNIHHDADLYQWEAGEEGLLLDFIKGMV